MFSFLDQWLFGSSLLTPHGFCLFWEPGLIWTFAISDAAIAIAYFSIPLALAIVARRRRDLIFQPVLWLFASFILLCGATHWLDLLTLWFPFYGLQGLVKALTAAVSVFAALALWRFLPQALAFPSPAQYREANIALMASQEQLGQAQKMEAVGQLTGGIAHDFNNMLQAVMSGLTLVERRIAQGRAEQVGPYLGAIRHAADNAASLTNRLLAFSRRQALQPRRIAPARLVETMAVLIRRTLGPEIELDLRAEEDVLDVVCDPNQLENILLNLAINARDAMPAGGSLMIATANRTLSRAQLAEPDVSPGRYVEITVRDTGTGMTPQVVARAFEPFFTTKPTGQGTGLGLSQVYGFVSQSGGVVRLHSSPGEGTTIRLYLPGHEAVGGERSGCVPGSMVLDALAFGAHGGTVLVVEDQDSIRGQIAEVLTEMGCTVLEAADGSEGLRLVQSTGAFDLLISDVGLPGLNGRQLADAARALQPDLPVLLITGYAGKALESVALPKGMELLRKPFSLEDLVARVGALLARPPG